MLNPRVTVVGGVRERAVVALSREDLHSSNQVLPSVSLKSQHPNQFYIVSRTLTPSLVPPLPKSLYVFRKDLEQLEVDLGTTDDRAAIIQRYLNTLAAKNDVGRELLIQFGFVMLTFQSSRKH